MLAILLQNAKLQERTLNLFLQFFLLLFIAMMCADTLFIAVPAWILAFQIGHYALIAITDIYEDDYPESRKKYYTYVGLIVYFIAGIGLGLYENEFVRLHTFIVLMGNWFGGKIDTVSWKVVFAVYMSTIIGFEIVSWGLVEDGFIALGYACIATGVICLCERLSEKNQQAWIIHTLLFFTWAMLQGAYYQEGVLFILGGLGYEVAKVTFGFAEHIENPKYKALIFS